MTSFALLGMAVGPVCEASARGWTPLHTAADEGHLACLEALLRAGAAKAQGIGFAAQAATGMGGEGEGHKGRPAPKAAASSTEWQNGVRERTAASVRCFNLKVPLRHPKVPSRSQALKKECGNM